MSFWYFTYLLIFGCNKLSFYCVTVQCKQEFNSISGVLVRVWLNIPKQFPDDMTADFRCRLHENCARTIKLLQHTENVCFKLLYMFLNCRVSHLAIDFSPENGRNLRIELLNWDWEQLHIISHKLLLIGEPKSWFSKAVSFIKKHIFWAPN